MHPSGELPEPENPPIMNLGCRLDTIFAHFKHIISFLLFLWAPVHYSIIVFKTLCTHVQFHFFGVGLSQLHIAFQGHVLILASSKQNTTKCKQNIK